MGKSRRLFAPPFKPSGNNWDAYELATLKCCLRILTNDTTQVQRAGAVTQLRRCIRHREKI